MSVTVYPNCPCCSGSGSGSGVGSGSGAGSGSTVTTGCCPGHPVNTTLFYTTSSRTGDCICVPVSGTVTHLGSSVWGTIDYRAACGLTACKDAGEDGNLSCVGGLWSHDGFTATSATCNPFEIVFNISKGGGTYVITFTE